MPAGDGTGTQVQHTGQQYEIQGGNRAGDNLFHSFEQFGLQTGETANFLADPSIAHILGRIVGGDPSYINGLIQVSNSNANLFLMNPAGMVFGANAQLDLGGIFTATTATGIGLASGWFPAIGTPDYSALVGSPNRFHFSEVATQASVVNLGHLAVSPGQGLMLAAGTVVNTGDLVAPGGNITLLAVQNPQVVRLSQAGMVLNLEFAPLDGEPSLDPSLVEAAFNPLGLADLLTGGQMQNATDLRVEADGTVRLGGSGLAIPEEAGTTIAQGTLDASSPITIGGNVTILGDRVALVGAAVDVSGTSGGLVRLGGDYQGQGTLPKAQATFIDGQTQILANALGTGDGGEVVVWSEGWSQFQGQIQAKGGTLGGHGGFVEVSGKETLAFAGSVDVSAPQGRWGTLLLDPTNITITESDSTPGVGAALPDIFAADFSPGDITIAASVLQNQAGNVVLEALDNITIAPGLSLTFVPGGSIRFTADQNGDGVGDFTMDPTQSITAIGRGLTITGANITTGAINLGTSDATPGGNLTLISTSTTGSSQINVTGDLTTTSPTGTSGSIYISANARYDATLNIAGNLKTLFPQGAAGDIYLGTSSRNQASTVTITGNLDSSVGSGSGDGGDIYLNVYNGNRANRATITITGNITTQAVNGYGGFFTLFADAGKPAEASANTALTITGNTNLSSQTGDGGSLDIRTYASGSSATNDITINGNLTSTSQGGSGGDMTIAAIPTRRSIFIGHNRFSTVQITGNLTTNTSSLTGNAGDINLQSYGYGYLQSGALGGEALLTVTGNLEATALGGNAGNITVRSNTYSYEDGGIADLTIEGIIKATGAGGGEVTLIAGGSCEGCTSSPTAVVGNIKATHITGNTITLAGQDKDGSYSVGTVTLGLVNAGVWEAQGGSLILENIVLRPGAFDLTLSTDDLVIYNPTTIIGTGNLALQPFSPGRDVYLGSTPPLGFTGFFPIPDLWDNLQDGFNSITLGRSNGTGVAFIGAGVTLQDPTFIRGSSSGYTLQGSDSSTVFTFDGSNVIQIADRGLNLVGNGSLRAIDADVIQGGASDDVFRFLALGSGITTIEGNGGNNTVETPMAQATLTQANGGTGSDFSNFLTIQNFTILGNNPFQMTTQPTGSLGGNLQTGSGDLTLVGDKVDIGGLISGTGALTFLTLTPNANTHLGNGVAGALNLDSPQLGRVQNGFREIRIGDPTGAGAVTGSGVFSFLDPVVIRSAQNRIDLGTATLQGTDNASFTLTAAQAIGTTTIDTQGHFIRLTSSQGAIAAGTLTSRGGDISLTAPGVITSGDLNSSSTNGGSITVRSGTAMTLGLVNSSGTLGNGGNVLLDPPGDIEVLAVNAQGNGGIGGTVDITTERFFRATTSFVDRNGITASLSTAGDLGNGALTLRHGGGPVTPFTVGRPVAPGGNGTLGTLTTGRFTVAPGLYPSSYSLTPSGEAFVPVGVGILPNLNIITTAALPLVPSPPPQIPTQTPPPTLVNQPPSPTLPNLGICPPRCEPNLPDLRVTQADKSTYLASTVETLETKVSQDIAAYLGLPPFPLTPLEKIKEQLQEVERITGVKPAVIYVSFQPRRLSAPLEAPSPDSSDSFPGIFRSPQDELELLMITGKENPVRIPIANIQRSQVEQMAALLRQSIMESSNTPSQRYLSFGQRLYQWLVAPLEATLQERGVENLLFVTETGLRLLPVAALHDGEQFLIEKYSTGMAPSISLTNLIYRDIRDSQMLAMGAAEFPGQNQIPLPMVPQELDQLVGSGGIWPGQQFLGESFTASNLERNAQGYGIIHLATHADFLPGAIDQSYIQLYDRRFSLRELGNLNWRTNNTEIPVELLTLSACQTATGSPDVELGFAGLAIQSGVKTALASLWYVSDVATTPLMTQFYQNLTTAPIKAEALRQAQLAFVHSGDPNPPNPDAAPPPNASLWGKSPQRSISPTPTIGLLSP